MAIGPVMGQGGVQGDTTPRFWAGGRTGDLLAKHIMENRGKVGANKVCCSDRLAWRVIYPCFDLEAVGVSIIGGINLLFSVRPPGRND